MLAKKVKKLISVIAATAIITSGLCCVNAAEDENVLYSSDFENAAVGALASTVGFVNMESDNTSATVEQDTETSKALKIVNGAGNYVYNLMDLSKIGLPIRGKAEISFDFKIENFTINFRDFLCLQTPNGVSARTFTFADWLYDDGWTNPIGIPTGEYVNFKLVLDFDAMQVSEYYGGNLRRTYALNAKVPDGIVMNMITTPFGGGDMYNAAVPFTMWVDNVNIKKIPNGIEKTVPANNSEVAPSTEVSATLVETIPTGSVTTSNVTVSENGRTLSSDEYVVSTAGSKIIVNVAGGLKGGANYVVVFKSSATGLDEDYTLKFKTLGKNVLYAQSFEGVEKGTNGRNLGFESDNQQCYSSVEEKDGNMALKMTNETLGTVTFNDRNFESITYPENMPIVIEYDVYLENVNRAFTHFASTLTGDTYCNNTSWGDTFYYHNSWSGFSSVGTGRWSHIRYEFDADKNSVKYIVNGSPAWEKITRITAPTFFELCQMAMSNPLGHGVDEDADNQIIWFDNFKAYVPEFNVRVTDSNGAYVPSIAEKNGAQITANITLTEDLADASVVAIAVKTTDGALKDVYLVTNGELMGGTASKSITMPNVDGETYKLEAFAVSGLANITPNADKITLN